MLFSLILGVILGGISVIFILENVSVVTITFLDWQFEGSLALVLLAALILGSLMTLLFLLPAFIRDTFYLSAVERQKKQLENDLAKTQRVLADVSSRSHGSGATTETTVA